MKHLLLFLSASIRWSPIMMAQTKSFNGRASKSTKNVLNDMWSLSFGTLQVVDVGHICKHEAPPRTQYKTFEMKLACVQQLRAASPIVLSQYTFN